MSATTPNAPIESKVYGATVGSFAATTLASLALWILGVVFWHAGPTAEASGLAVAAVPGPVHDAVLLLIAAAGAFVGGYLARHTPRVLDAVIAPLTDGTEVPAPVEVNAPAPDQPIDPADTTSGLPPEPVNDTPPADTQPEPVPAVV